MSRAAISKHLKVLEDAGLIEIGREAQRRPRTLNAKPLGQAAKWLERYRQFWEGSYERLDAVLEGMKAASPKPPRSKKGRG